jgi:hypothetical protein
VSPSLVNEINWKLLPLMGSDHRPVLTSIITSTGDQGHSKHGKSTTFKYKIAGKSIRGRCRRDAADRGRTHQHKMNTHNPKWANEEVEVIWNAKMAASKDYTKANKGQS